jgi:hypothetical protein
MPSHSTRGAFTPEIPRGTLTPQQQRDFVRELARAWATRATSPEMQQILQRWRDVNALRKPDRAPVWCKPVGCWEEILPEDSLVCEDPFLRNWERQLRRDLVKIDIDDDTPLTPYFEVRAQYRVEPENTWGVEIGKHKPDESGGAWRYDPPLKDEADFDRLAMPSYSYDEAATGELAARANDLLGEILPVVVNGGPGFDSATLGTAAADLRGLEQMMMDTILAPDLLHRLMAHLRDARMRMLDAMRANPHVLPNTYQPMLCSDPVGPAVEDGGYTLANCWCAGNSQEFDQVGPEDFQRFLLDYQMPIFERFAYSCYGCCENLTKKIDQVLKIPNLRIFVCSAWTDLDVVLDRCGQDYCIMWRQKASDVVFPDDDKTIRRDLEEGMKRLQGRCYQVVLRELQTLCGHDDRLHAWTAAAKELAAKYA